jgi:CheY-like chemotaxis protein
MLFGRQERTIRRILLVEDEPLVAFDNEHILSDAGYEVIATVDTESEALEIINSTPVDLLVADVQLSRGNGLDVAKAAATRNIPVLFATGSCPIGAQEFAVGCLAKPYSDRALRTAVQAIDALLAGREPKSTPKELSLYVKPAK